MDSDRVPPQQFGDAADGEADILIGGPAIRQVLRSSKGRRSPSAAWRGPCPLDEARVGQKNKVTRRWARRGTRPVAPQDQRTASTYIFGAICPRRGTAAALVLPRCNTRAMTLHLAEIARAVAPGAHAVLLVDQAGWHLSRKLVVPSNIAPVPLPPNARS